VSSRRQLATVLAALAAVGAVPLLAAGPEDHAVPRADVRAPAAPVPEPERAEPNVRGAMPAWPAAPLPVAARISPEPSPSPSVSFLAEAGVPAVGSTKTESPPDTDGAVGRDKLMVALNSNYVIQRKSDGALLSTMSMDAFWSPVGARHPFDPRVLYDPYSDRWLVSAGDDPLLASSRILYGISATGDPQGAWHLYALDADRTLATWADYPTLGFNQSTVAIGANMFSTGGLTYVRGRLIVLDYASLRAGGNGDPVELNVPDGFALQPVATYSPTETTLYVFEHFESAAGTYRLWALNGSKLTLVGDAPHTNPLGPWATPGPGNLLPQERGGGIDSGDSRVGNAVFRNNHIYYAQTIGMPPGPAAGNVIHTAVQWGELDTSGAFVQGGRIEDTGANPWNGGRSYAFASVAVNARNDLIVGFSEFESDDFVDAGYAFRAGSDPPNTLRAPVTLKDGEGPYDKKRGGRNRWGDFSTSSVDPSDDLSLWTLQEYARAPSGKGAGSGRWGVWWGRVGGGPPQPHLQCLVPKLTGKTLREARSLLGRSQCRVGSVGRLKSTKKTKGRVLRQRPAARTTLDAAARVDLWLGKGPARPPA
jgi:hypothetical protein